MTSKGVFANFVLVGREGGGQRRANFVNATPPTFMNGFQLFMAQIVP